MTLLRPRLLLLLTAVLAATACSALAAPAFGATFCVHQPGDGCPAGSTDSGADLQSALDSAAATPAADTIRIGAGTYSKPSTGFSYDSASPVDVLGAGRGQTTLTGDAANKPVILFGPTASPGSSISLLKVHVPGQQGAVGISMSGGSVHDVDVDSDPGVSYSAAGIVLSAATLRNSQVKMTPTSAAYVDGVRTSGGSSEIDDSTISSPYTGVDSMAPLTIHRSRMSGLYAVSEIAAALTMDSSLLVATPAGQTVSTGLLVGTTYGPEASANVQNTTIVNSGSGGVGVYATASGPNTGSEIDLTNSIVWGFASAYVLHKDQGAAYALVIPSNSDVNGDTAGIAGAQMHNVDPAFVDAAHGDYRLRFDSPLIDLSSFTEAQESATDLDGNPRTVNVKSNGTPRDIGAYEYQHRTPVASPTASPAHGPVGQIFTFDATASTAPDDGDSITSYAWSFDNGAKANGPVAALPLGSPGPHTATLTVTEASGLQSTRTVTVTVDRPAQQQAPAPSVKLNGAPHSDGKTITISITCTVGPCAGTFTGSTTERLSKSGSIIGLQRPAKRTKTVSIGSRNFSLAAGNTETLKLTINARGRTLLRRFHRLPTTLAIALRQANGKLVMVAQRRLTVKPSK